MDELFLVFAIFLASNSFQENTCWKDFMFTGVMDEIVMK